MAAPNPAPGAAGAPPPRERPVLRLITSRIKLCKQRLAVISQHEALAADGVPLAITPQQLRDSKVLVEGVLEELERIHRNYSDVLNQLFPLDPPEEIEEEGDAVKDDGAQENEESEKGDIMKNGEETKNEAREAGGNNQSEEPSSSASAWLQQSFSAVVMHRKDTHTLEKFKNFLSGFRVDGDASPYYVGQAIAVASVGSSSMNILYSHLDTAVDKDWVRNLVNSKDRLAGELETIALEFVRYVAKSYKMKREIVKLKLKFVQMPKSRESLQAVLVVSRTTEQLTVHLQNEPAVKPSPFGSELLSGILFNIVKNHRLGKSWDGKLTLNDFEVINGHWIIISKKPIQYEIGDRTIPVETRKAFWNDLGVIPKLILPTFMVKGLSHPHLPAFTRCLQKFKLNGIRTWSALEDHYELVIHHAFLKPPIAVLNLFTGIHSSCRAHDEGDESAWYKTVLDNYQYQKLEGEDACESWIDLVKDSDNELLVEILEYPNQGFAEPGRPLPEPYDGTHQSFCSYVRHSGVHTFDYTRRRRHFQPVLEGKDGPVEEKLEPREQLLKFQDEVVTTAALFLADVMEAVIAQLIRSKAMTGMLLTHWKVYKNCTSYDKPEDKGDVENEDV